LKLEADACFQRRQMLPQVAQEAAEHTSEALFTEHFLPALERLGRDPVINVRIVVARMLADPKTGLCRQKRWGSDARLTEVIEVLKTDSDRDVHYFAHRLDDAD